MSRAAISWGRAAAMLTGLGFSDLAISDIMRAAKRAGTYDGAAYYYPDDILAEADSYIDGLSIDDCGSE